MSVNCGAVWVESRTLTDLQTSPERRLLSEKGVSLFSGYMALTKRQDLARTAILASLSDANLQCLYIFANNFLPTFVPRM
jgi:hypothetical protein